MFLHKAGYTFFMAGNAYNHKEVEQKWQKIWAERKTFETPKLPKSDKKCYILDMFPYPSGDGLHVGHPKGYIATDVYARMKRMQGYDVLHPMGWDAFGLPAENYAIKNKVHPRVAVEKNIARFKEQLKNIGFSYDWDREINTTDPEYYKWTQWIFLQLYKKGLAYESFEPINWCPSCQTGLANEDLEQGTCERCGSVIEKRPMRQWVLKITEYAEQLLAGLEGLPWPKSIVESQKNWIGKSEGVEVSFQLAILPPPPAPPRAGGENATFSVDVFTTRPDTLFGVTYLVLAPEHKSISELLLHAKNTEEVKKYISESAHKTEIDRTDAKKEKTGVELKGVMAINPATGKEIPVWVADYVLIDYGTGAVMAVPAHDERDFEFARKYKLPMCIVVCSNYPAKTCPILDEAYLGNGYLVESGEYNGLTNETAKEKITEKFGRKKTTYKLRDWVFSRQRYWGEPIPIIHCDKCGVVPVPEEQLPVVLPEVELYEPTGTGESPLAKITNWVNTTCPTCGGAAMREINTMPQWAGSSWYYLRFIDPKNSANFVDAVKEKAWMPVDVYVGGAEHATRHLIYARFWHIVLHELGIVSTLEPFMRLENVGLILAEDGRKMSKRYGNVVNPDDIVNMIGADTLRIYEMFMGPFNQAVSWSTAGMSGPRRFIERIWRLVHAHTGSSYADTSHITALLHRTIKKVSDDTQMFRFNTAISSLMELLNALEKEKNVSPYALETLVLLTSPYAPHVCEELWEFLGHADGIAYTNWPVFEAGLIHEDTGTIAIQVNGKVRGDIAIPYNASQEDVDAMARAQENVARYLAEISVKKVIYVSNRLINFVG